MSCLRGKSPPLRARRRAGRGLEEARWKLVGRKLRGRWEVVRMKDSSSSSSRWRKVVRKVWDRKGWRGVSTCRWLRRRVHVVES